MESSSSEEVQVTALTGRGESVSYDIGKKIIGKNVLLKSVSTDVSMSGGL